METLLADDLPARCRRLAREGRGLVEGEAIVLDEQAVRAMEYEGYRYFNEQIAQFVAMAKEDVRALLADRAALLRRIEELESQVARLQAPPTG